MARKLRFIPPGSVVEVTARTVQSRFLLKPGPGWRETFVGALARARERYRVDVHDFVCLSTHLHLLLSPENARELAGFMRHFLSKLSLEAAKRHGWGGPLFQRRYQTILVSGEARAQEARLRYLLAHGVKENLVASAMKGARRFPNRQQSTDESRSRLASFPSWHANYASFRRAPWSRSRPEPSSLDSF